MTSDPVTRTEGDAYGVPLTPFQSRAIDRINGTLGVTVARVRRGSTYEMTTVDGATFTEYDVLATVLMFFGASPPVTEIIRLFPRPLGEMRELGIREISEPYEVYR